MAKEFAEEYKKELAGLRQPDKAKINFLSMLAEDNRNYADAIVNAVEQHIHQCPPPARLPALYVVDSIIKNVKEPYKTLFSKRLDEVFGKVWSTTLPDKRVPLIKLCNTWDGVLAPDVVSRVRARMGGNSSGHGAPAASAGPVQQQQHPGMGFQHRQQPAAAQHPSVQQQQSAVQMAHAPQQPQQHMLQQHQMLVGLPPQLPPGQLPPGAILVPNQQPGGVLQLVSMQPAPPAQQMVVVGPNGQLLTVAQHPPQPQLIQARVQQHPVSASAIPQHMASGLPPVSPAHPAWQQQQQQPPPPPRPMQQQQQQLAPGAAGPMVRRSPAYPASPAVVQASPHHTSTRSPHHRAGTSPQHMSAPGSASQRSGSPAAQAEHIAASLSSLLQGLTQAGYLNDPALKTTSFDPAFLKKEHKGVVALLKAASDSTRARFKDIQFQRNKRRKDAQSSSTMLSRSWYLPVESWITGTALVGAAAEAAESEEQVSEDNTPAPPPTVDADPQQTHCAISGEPFDSYYDQDRETWVYRGAVRLQGPEAEQYGVPDGSLVKVECLAAADLGSSPAALAAAAAAAGGGAGGEDEADLAAAAAAAPAAGQQEQPPATAAAAAKGGGTGEVLQQAELPHIKLEQQQEDGAAAAAIKLEPSAAAAAGLKQQQDTVEQQQPQQQQSAAAAGVKREAGDGEQLQQQQQGTPTKKRRVSPEP